MSREASLEQEVRGAAAHLLPVAWSPERQESVREAIHRRRRRFALSSVALSSAAVAVAVAIALVWLAQGQRGAAEKTFASIPDAPLTASLALRDGTRAVGLSEATSLRLVSESQEAATFALDRGKAWFDVTPSQTRRVQVQVREVRVEVLGTEFVVEVRGEEVHVWVHRGKVAVHSGDSNAVVETGGHKSFPATAPPKEQSKAPEAPPKVEAPAPTPVKRKEPPPRLEPEAALPMDAGMESTTPTVSELWTQADRARRNANAELAIATLKTLVVEHPEDGRAALAAFTLGRVLLDSGESASSAARAFAKARKLSPDGPLVEDALLREVEAWLLAGDMKRVRSRSEKYLRLFPGGRYREQILLMAGGE